MPPENAWFRPERLARLRNVYLAIVAIVIFLPVVAGAAYVAVTAEDPVVGVVAGGVGAAVVGLLAFLVWYNRAFERSAAYRLGPEEIQYRRGVWIEKESSVPYRRITNVTTSEGPIQRWVGAGSVAVQTAGQSGQAGAELTVSGVPDHAAINERVREKVSAVRGADDAGDDAGKAAKTADDDLLAEVRRIRELLEERA